jgi:hypothetical protein
MDVPFCVCSCESSGYVVWRGKNQWVIVMSQVVANKKGAKVQGEISMVSIHLECRACNAPAVQDQTYTMKISQIKGRFVPSFFAVHTKLFPILVPFENSSIVCSMFGDFGASELQCLDKYDLTMFIQGTFGYLDLGIFFIYHLSDKSEIYSFGVVVWS